jgi:hypothetical protein
MDDLYVSSVGLVLVNVQYFSSLHAVCLRQGPRFIVQLGLADTTASWPRLTMSLYEWILLFKMYVKLPRGFQQLSSTYSIM